MRLQTPLLLPKNKKLYDVGELACFMDHSGMLVTLPYDLRVSPTHKHTEVCVCAQTLIILLFASAHANTITVRDCNQQPP